mmetsp:Transcript_24364/g.36810  ORF Transcript_24364/g.36810 Transcript_24364/m.36810 type:complete len:83 (-) Transcript_24364:55-303(-)
MSSSKSSSNISIVGILAFAKLVLSVVPEPKHYYRRQRLPYFFVCYVVCVCDYYDDAATNHANGRDISFPAPHPKSATKQQRL